MYCLLKSVPLTHQSMFTQGKSVIAGVYDNRIGCMCTNGLHDMADCFIQTGNHPVIIPGTLLMQLRRRKEAIPPRPTYVFLILEKRRKFFPVIGCRRSWHGHVLVGIQVLEPRLNQIVSRNTVPGIDLVCSAEGYRQIKRSGAILLFTNVFDGTLPDGIGLMHTVCRHPRNPRIPVVEG